MTDFSVGQIVFVPECVCTSQDSVLPVQAVVVEVRPEGRYVVRARGDDLDVTADEIQTTAQAWRDQDAASRARASS